MPVKAAPLAGVHSVQTRQRLDNDLPATTACFSLWPGPAHRRQDKEIQRGKSPRPTGYPLGKHCKIRTCKGRMFFAAMCVPMSTSLKSFNISSTLPLHVLLVHDIIVLTNQSDQCLAGLCLMTANAGQSMGAFQKSGLSEFAEGMMTVMEPQNTAAADGP